MKAEELRIGNFVTTIVSDKSCKIDGITQQQAKDGYFQLIFIGDKSFIKEHVLAIPLTEEWLVKFGFEKQKTPYLNDGYLGYDFVHENDFEIAIFEDGFIYNTAIHRINIKYVHQLQNLFFALTEKELELKE